MLDLCLYEFSCLDSCLSGFLFVWIYVCLNLCLSGLLEHLGAFLSDLSAAGESAALSVPHAEHSFGEQSVELRVDKVGDHGEILRAVLEVEMVGIDGQNLSLIAADPVFVFRVQPREIFDAYGFFIVASAFLYL